MGKNLVREFITDEFKMPVQAVLDQALHGEETANFGTYELVEEVLYVETSFYDDAHIHTLLLLVTSLISLHALMLHLSMPFSTEFPLMTKGGVRLDVLLNATTRRDEQGNVIGVVGTCLLFFVS